MRKLLLATTALVAFAGAANAAEHLTVEMGGYTDFRAASFDQDRKAAGATLDSTDRDFQTEYKLNVDVKGKANGMDYGARVSLWNGKDTIGATTDESTNLDQAFVHVGGTWGKVELGDAHGASDLMVYAPTVGQNQVDGNYTQFVTTHVWGVLPTFIDNTEDATKVSYYTPSFSGFQAGVSFAPQETSKGTDVQLDNTSSNQYEDVMEFGAKYNGKFDKVNFTLAGNIVTGDANTKATTVLRDFTSYGVGAQVGFAGFTFGGSYVDGDEYGVTKATTTVKDQTVWTVGAKYEMNQLAVAASYLMAEGYKTNPANVHIDEYTAWGVGATYNWAPGLVTALDATWFEQDDGVAAVTNDADGQVIMLSQRVNF